MLDATPQIPPLLGERYFDLVRLRLQRTFAPAPECDLAIQVLTLIIRNLAEGSYACAKTATDLSLLRAVDATMMSRTLRLLEGVGAISRVKDGRRKIISVNVPLTDHSAA